MRVDLCIHPRSIYREEVYRYLSKIVELFRTHEVNHAFLFGSILYNKNAGDLDIAVYFKEKKRSSIELYSDIYLSLCAIFKADNVDVVILNETGPAFRFEVISKGELIYSTTPDEATAFFEKILFDYMDSMPFRQESHQELIESIMEGLMKDRKLNIQRIDTYLKKMKEAIADIQRINCQIQKVDEFLSSEKKDIRNLCIHHLRITLESVLDIARHIIAVKGFGITDLETENIIDILGRYGVIPYEFSQKIRGMAGMRNAIVHVYWNLDYEKIYEMVKNRLVDFEDFARYIIEYVEREK